MVDSYLQKTDDVTMFDDIDIQNMSLVQLPSADNEEQVLYNLDEYGVVKINNVMNLIELENIREYARDNMYKGDKTDAVIVDKHKHIVFAKGRQDMWHIDLPLTIPEEVKNVLDIVMKVEYKQSSIGVLTLDANTNHMGRWHRDVMPLFKLNVDPDVNDKYTLELPNFYFTVFIPLTQCRKENGATEMLLKSHVSDEKNVITIAEGNPGDVIIMNGKLLHRSVPNVSDLDRDLLYIIYCAKWYDEEKF